MCLKVGLLPFRHIFITASLSSNKNNFDNPDDNAADGGTKSISRTNDETELCDLTIPDRLGELSLNP